MLSVFHLLDRNFEENPAGVEKFTLELTKNSPFLQEILCASQFKLAQPHSFQRLLLPNRILEERVLSRLVQAENTVIHVHQILPWGFPLLRKIARRFPTVFHVHDYFLWCQKVHLLDHREKVCTGPGAIKCSFCHRNKRSALFYPPIFQWRLLEAWRFLSDIKTILLPNKDLLKFIPKRFHSKVEIIPYSIPRFELSAGVKRSGAVLVGPPAQHKGIWRFLEHWKELREPFEVHLYGPGWSKDQIPPGVQFHGLLEDPSQLQNYNCLVLPSQWKETGPMIVQEALLAGCNVYAHRGSLHSGWWKVPGIQPFSKLSEIDVSLMGVGSQIPLPMHDVKSLLKRLYEKCLNQNGSIG